MSEAPSPEPVTVGWHVHRWTEWGSVFNTSGGIIAAFSGASTGPWWQDRSCVVCKKVQRSRVDIQGKGKGK